MSQREIWHKRIYWLTLFGVVIGLPLNKVVLSLSGLLMALNWLIEGRFSEKWAQLVKHKTGLLLTIIYLVAGFTLFYSEDISYGLKDLRIKLPMLLFPVVILSSNPLPRELYKKIMLTFVIAVLITTGINFYVFQSSDVSVLDSRQMSLFDSHIRLALMVAFSAFLSFRYLFEVKLILKPLVLGVLFWFVFYTLKSEVLTGYFSFFIVTLVLVVWYLFNSTKLPKIALSIGILLSTAALFYLLFLNVYPIPKEDLIADELPKYTELGGLYEHNPQSTILENGYFIHSYICTRELDSVWQIRTGTSLLSNENQELYPTLLRYMTSMGLRKDALGLNKLSDNDIANIKMGFPSIVYAKGGLKSRLARITMELQKQLEGADPNGSTIQQRLEYWRTGWSIIKSNFLFGVGIGDIQNAFYDAYEKNDSRLHIENRLHTHQQFMTIWIGAGLVVFILFLVYILATLKLALTTKSYTLLVFWTIITFSYFFEDTLETQVGVTLAAFFITFILKHEPVSKLFENQP